MGRRLSLTHFDALGTIIGFRFKGHNRNRTAVGGFLTIFVFIITVVTLIFFGNIYLTGSEISQFNTIIKYWNSQNITLDEDFEVAILTRYNGSISEREDIWKIDFFYVESIISTGKYSETPIPTRYCNKSHWTKVDAQFTFLNLDKGLCFDTNDYLIMGNYNTDIFKYIKITYTLMVDLDDPEKIAQYSEEISNLSPVTSLFFMEGAFEVTGKNSKPTYFINSVNVNATWGDAKDIEIFVSQDSVKISQDRIIYTDNQEIRQFVLSDSIEKISVRPDSKRNSLSYKIMSANKLSVLKVNFMTLSEMLARIGGIVQNLITLIVILNYFRTYWEFEVTHINSILEKLSIDYLMSCNKVNDELQKQSKEKSFSTRKKSEYNDKQSERAKSKETKECLLLMKKDLNPFNFKKMHCFSDLILKETVSQGKLKLSYSEYFKYKYFNESLILCFNRLKGRKNEVYNFANHYLTKSIEVDNSEKVYSQFQALKYLTMSPSELELFENLPLIHLNQIIDKITELSSKGDQIMIPNLNIEKIAADSILGRKLVGLFYI